MSVAAILCLCLLVLLALGLAERVARDRALSALPIRVHVNGTRAKSTVTRLIWSALVEAGIPAVAKTTGTAPRLLLPDRREVPLARRGPANIREQLALARRARRLGARALVAECMAIDPDLQHAAEHQMIRATVGVITNVRLDHTESMGDDLTAVADSLSNTIPRRAAFITADGPFAARFRTRASRLGTDLVVADSPAASAGDSRAVARWLAEDLALALAVTRKLGIDDKVAEAGFRRAPRDPGEMRQGALALRGGDLHWLDASASNDPESLAILLDGFDRWRKGPAGRAGDSARILVYHHRADRASRLACFADHCDAFSAADRLVVTGARPPLSVWTPLARRRATGTTEFVAGRCLAGWLAAHAGGATVAFCGNTRGLDVLQLIEEAASR